MAAIDEIRAARTAEQVQAVADRMGVVLGRLDVYVHPHVRVLWEGVQAVKPDEKLLALCLHTIGIDEIAIVVPGEDESEDLECIRRMLLAFADEVSATEPAWIRVPELPEVEWLTLRLQSGSAS